MNKHTPGPWHIDSAGIDGNTGYYRFSISPSVGTPIVSDWVSVLGRTYAELEANAKLIAAAPELLEALQAIVSLPYAPWGMHEKQARQAIAKATE